MTRVVLTILVLLQAAGAGATVFYTNAFNPNSLAFLHSIAADGDTIVVTNIASAGTWSSPLSWTKAVSLIGPGTNALSGKSTQLTGGGDPTTMCMFNFNVGSSTPFVFANMSLTNSVNGGACCLYGIAPALRVHSVLINGFKFANYFYLSSLLVDHSTLIDNILGMTSYYNGTGSNRWYIDFPLAFTNVLKFADLNLNDYVWTASYPYNGSGGHAIAAGGQGGSYIVRNSTVECVIDQFAPAFDAHGDQAQDTDLGMLCNVIYSNTFTLSGTASMDKFFDCRGGMGLIIGNTLTGTGLGSVRGVFCREEHVGINLNITPDPQCEVTNVYSFANTVNGVNMVTQDDGTGPAINVNYFTAVPSNPAWLVPYIAPPHPLMINDPAFTNPSPATKSPGQTATFTTTASSQTSLPLTYQWFKNGTTIAGATQSAYTTPSLVLGDNGNTYLVAVTDLLATTNTASALLTVSGGSVLKTYGKGTRGRGTR